MKKLLPLLLLFYAFYLSAQTKITKSQVESTEGLFDVQFTDANRDSLVDAVQNYLATYQSIHKIHLENSLAPALVFNPIPAGFHRPQIQSVIRWNIPETAADMPANDADLAFYSIRQLASLIYHKKISSVKLTQFFLQRLKMYGDTLHCVVSLTEATALQQARQADDELAKGNYKGVLHGIPFGVKDLLAVAGTKTTWGAAPFKDQSIEKTAFVVQKLQDAGAVLIVKLSMGSLALGDVWFGGKTRNPWDLKQGSSGSSAGSASATAAGLVPFAIGTETLGSIVSPSTRCGATGLRPTFGAVSRSGAMALCWSLDKIGPIARSAEDDAIVFNAIRGVDEADPSTRSSTFIYTGRADFHTLKIAYAKNYFDSLPKDRNDWNTLETFRSLGASLIPIDFKTTAAPNPSGIVSVILGAECSAAFDELTRSRRDTELTEQSRFSWPTTFRAARFIPAVEYINANRIRTKMIQEINALVGQYDAIITPTFAGPQLAITNMTGHPAVVMPNGFKDGKPTSITIIGNLYDEATILSVAKAFQDATDFNKKRPEIFK